MIARAIAKTLRFPGVDFVCNAWPGMESYPEGLDIEIYKMKTLETICDNASLPSEREHLAPYIWNHKNDFWIKHEKNKRDYSYMRFTVDYPSDIAMVEDAYQHFGDKLFLMDEIVNYWFQFPQKMRTKRNVPRKEGINKTIKEDEKWKSIPEERSQISIEENGIQEIRKKNEQDAGNGILKTKITNQNGE